MGCVRRSDTPTRAGKRDDAAEMDRSGDRWQMARASKRPPAGMCAPSEAPGEAVPGQKAARGGRASGLRGLRRGLGPGHVANLEGAADPLLTAASAGVARAGRRGHGFTRIEHGTGRGDRPGGYPKTKLIAVRAKA